MKTTMDCHSKLVLHSLQANNQAVQVIMHQRRQTALIFPGACDVSNTEFQKKHPFLAVNKQRLAHDL